MQSGPEQIEMTWDDIESFALDLASTQRVEPGLLKQAAQIILDISSYAKELENRILVLEGYSDHDEPMGAL